MSNSMFYKDGESGAVSLVVEVLTNHGHGLPKLTQNNLSMFLPPNNYLTN
jgi:hypothetical protein